MATYLTKWIIPFASASNSVWPLAATTGRVLKSTVTASASSSQHQGRTFASCTPQSTNKSFKKKGGGRPARPRSSAVLLPDSDSIATPASSTSTSTLTGEASTVESQGGLQIGQSLRVDDGFVDQLSYLRQEVVMERSSRHIYTCTCHKPRVYQDSQDIQVQITTCAHLVSVLGLENERTRLVHLFRTLPFPTQKKVKLWFNKLWMQTAPKGSEQLLQRKKRSVEGEVGVTATASTASPSPSSTSTPFIPPEAERVLSTSLPSSSTLEPGHTPGLSTASISELPTATKREVKLLLANKFEIGGKKDPTGWFISEKLDGVRAYWDGEGGLWSRLGNPFLAPSWFTSQLPIGTTLDGELFSGRNEFSKTVSIVRSYRSEKWGEIRYKVFDIPSLVDAPFEARMEALQTLFPPNSSSSTSSSIVDLVSQEKCRDVPHLMERLEEIQRLGGEGLMLRQPGSLYVGKRSMSLLKVKTFLEGDAEVIGYEAGKGKYVDQCGSLLCRMASGKTFNVGSGLDDAQRLKPPAIGSIISYRFQEMTKEQVPRFPTFIGERIDLKEAKDPDDVTSNA